MKRILALSVVLFLALGAVSFANELEKAKEDYTKVVSEFTDNLNNQKMLVEGFKATNSTYQALVKRQVQLQQIAKKLSDKIKELEVPDIAEPPTPSEAVTNEE